MSMVVNRRDIAFYLNELFDLPSLLTTPLFNEHDVESIEAIFDVVQQIAEEVFLPCAAELDEHEPRFDNGQALTPASLKDCVTAYRDAGLCGATFGHDVGGLQLPCVVTNLIQGILMAANAPALGYMTLTAGNAHMLQACGNDALKQRYLAPMVEGRWFGTMCLSEPQAGSSLSDIRTLATPVGDGSYQLSGTKMWISGGDHDLTENIVHMVLARTPDAPAGTRGISLFLVPKHRVNEDGSLGDFNHVVLAGLNHKMGQRGTTNTLLNFGESGECIGYLVGEEHQGLRNMFHMMNEARIGVGMLATMSGLAGYLYSLDYARNRPQGRHPGDKDPTTPMLPIIEHADIKRLLLEQKSAVEGSIALLSYCSALVDRQLTAADEETRQRLTLLLELMTPIAKSWPSEFTLEANKHAIQVLGGYGYTREYPVERLYRDNRLNPIHEGTHAIHGMDLLGRKVTMANGMALTLLAEEMLPTINSARSARELVPYAQALEETWQAVLEAVDSNKACPDAVLRLANATPFLDAFGHVVIAWLWLWQAQVAQEKLANASGADQDFYRGKIQTCAFFYRYQLPKVYHWLSLARDLDATCVDMAANQF
jgi:alkylation response protein AidB-like acyl-CoA dehydrogenase